MDVCISKIRTWSICIAVAAIIVPWSAGGNAKESVSIRSTEKECLSSPERVRLRHGRTAWSGFSSHVAGHEGTRCYFLSHGRKEDEPTRVTTSRVDPWEGQRVLNNFRLLYTISRFSEVAYSTRGLAFRVKEWFEVQDAYKVATGSGWGRPVPAD